MIGRRREQTGADTSGERIISFGPPPSQSCIVTYMYAVHEHARTHGVKNMYMFQLICIYGRANSSSFLKGVESTIC